MMACAVWLFVRANNCGTPFSLKCLQGWGSKRASRRRVGTQNENFRLRAVSFAKRIRGEKGPLIAGEKSGSERSEFGSRHFRNSTYRQSRTGWSGVTREKSETVMSEYDDQLKHAVPTALSLASGASRCDVFKFA
ncbi:uncharacterized protein [Bemisia tabaci]|uniref:uncharacterized protein n=1 Tax=Bemisia tabaci TaxID=7038 RepID=UPI003B27F0F5